MGLMKDDKIRKAMAVSSIEISKSTYSKEVFARKIESIYKSVI